jgi:RNA polymerase sigma factor (sigma-70 family)
LEKRMGFRDKTENGGAADITDGELLRQFVSERSESAFRELVERHQQMVFATCRRGLAGNHDLARDAAQSVFLVLAEKARSLKSYEDVGGWLFRTATLVVRDMNKTEWRRRMRETHAVQAAEAEAETVSPERVEEMRAHLNDAISDLKPRLRDVVIMHLENMTLAEAAGRLACTVDAAQKRLQRAEQYMKEFFRGRGFVVSGVAALSLLKTEAVVTMSAEAAKACQAAAGGLSGAGVAAGSVIAAKGVLTKMTWWLHLKTLAAVLVTTGALAGTTELWKKTEEAQSKGLPRTAITEFYRRADAGEMRTRVQAKCYDLGRYYASQVLYRAGGECRIPWYGRYAAAMKTIQAEDGSFKDADGNSVYPTAVAPVILEAPLRYMPYYMQ